MPAPTRRRLRRAKPAGADPDAQAPTVPLTSLTVVRPEPIGDEPRARRWLDSLRGDPEAVQAELDAALALINRAVHAHRTTALDANVPDVAADQALAIRIGFGSGDELADGRYAAAIEIPRPDTRSRRSEALRPHERIAAVLGGRERVGVFEGPLLRARADLDAGRGREAALQLRIGLAALLAAREQLDSATQRADLDELSERRDEVVAAGRDALTAELDPDRSAAVAATLAICERVLKRRRLP